MNAYAVATGQLGLPNHDYAAFVTARRWAMRIRRGQPMDQRLWSLVDELICDAFWYRFALSQTTDPLAHRAKHQAAEFAHASRPWKLGAIRF